MSTAPIALRRTPEEHRRALALLPCGACGAAGPHHLFEETGQGVTAACVRCGEDVGAAAGAVEAA